MSRLLPNLRIAPVIRPFADLPIREFEENVERRIEDFDIARESFDILESQKDILIDQVLPFEGDRQITNEVVNKYTALIDEAAETGDYENMLRQVRRYARDFNKEVTPLLNRKRQYDQYRQDLLKNDKITSRQKSAALARVEQLNNRQLAAGEGLGGLQLITPANFVDITKLLDERIAGVKASGNEFISVPDANGNIIRTRIEEIREDDIRRMAQDIAGGSVEYQNYLQSENELGNLDLATAEFNDAVNFVANKYGCNKTQKFTDRLATGDGDGTEDTGGRAVTGQFKVPRSTKFDDVGNIIPEDKRGFGELFAEKMMLGEDSSGWDLIKKAAGNPNMGLNAFARSVTDYFFQEATLSPEQQKVINTIETGRERAGEWYNRDISREAYMQSILADETLPTVELNPDSQRKETQALFDVTTGGGKFTGMKVYSNEKGFLDADKLFKEEFDIDIEDLEELSDDEVKNIMTITEISDPNNNGHNSFFPRYKIASRQGKEFIIDDSKNATAEELFGFKMYNLAKQNGSGTTTTIEPDGNLVEIDYFWDPINGTWGFTDIRVKNKDE